MIKKIVQQTNSSAETVFAFPGPGSVTAKTTAEIFPTKKTAGAKGKTYKDIISNNNNKSIKLTPTYLPTRLIHTKAIWVDLFLQKV